MGYQLLPLLFLPRGELSFFLCFAIFFSSILLTDFSIGSFLLLAL